MNQMGMARALDYDDLHGWLEEHASDASSMARDAEEEHDVEGQRFMLGRMSAFNDLISHIEAELSWSRR